RRQLRDRTAESRDIRLDLQVRCADGQYDDVVRVSGGQARSTLGGGGRPMTVAQLAAVDGLREADSRVLILERIGHRRQPRQRQTNLDEAEALEDPRHTTGYGGQQRRQRAQPGGSRFGADMLALDDAEVVAETTRDRLIE